MSETRSRWLLVAVAAVAMLIVPLAVPAAAGDEDGAPAEVEPGEEAPVQEIKMIARNWYWDPDRIRVKQGTRIILRIQGFDAPHAFQLKAYGLKVPIREGETTTVDFVADKAGEFVWRCGRPCGNGCPKMRGKLVVVE
jgi:heme/copper-type cytochrome/quinol oxidase subunit 2